MAIFKARNDEPNVGGIKSETDVANREVDGDAESRDLDDADMARMGKRQQTRRNFGLITMLGFTTTMMCTWEGGFPLFGTPFVNGGSVTMIYGFVFAWVGSLATCSSLAEMASMYPTSGGQYHWVAIMAPPKWSKFLSFMTGWVSVLGWQAGVATGTFFGAIVMQGLASLGNANYTPQRWQGTLIFYCVLALACFVNTVLAKYLPALEGLILILHIVGFFAVLIPLVHLSPISDASFVFRDSTNVSGHNDGISWLIGMATTSVLFVGYDGACHMAEEVKHAALNVPRSMIFTVFLNGTLGFAMYLVILFTIGDIEAVLGSATGWPFIQLFVQGLQSQAGATAMTSLLISMYIFASFGFLASASRQCWAFARDRALPFSTYLSRIDRRTAIPLWAIGFSVVFNVLLALINIASSTAWNAIISLVVAGFYSSYLIAIGCMMYRRMQPERLVLGPWNLGRFGTATNVVAMLYALIAMVFSFFPPTLPVSAQSMNYSVVVYFAVVSSGLVYYALRGRKMYNGPVIDRQFTS